MCEQPKSVWTQPCDKEPENSSSHLHRCESVRSLPQLSFVNRSSRSWSADWKQLHSPRKASSSCSGRQAGVPSKGLGIKGHYVNPAAPRARTLCGRLARLQREVQVIAACLLTACECLASVTLMTLQHKVKGCAASKWQNSKRVIHLLTEKAPVY